MENGEVAMMLAPVLTPHGVLTLGPSGDAACLEPDLGSRLEKAFAKGPGLELPRFSRGCWAWVLNGFGCIRLFALALV